MVKPRILPEDLTKAQLCILAREVTQDNFTLRGELEALQSKLKAAEERVDEYGNLLGRCCETCVNDKMGDEQEPCKECWEDKRRHLTHYQPIENRSTRRLTKPLNQE